MRVTEAMEYLVGDMGLQTHKWTGGYYCACGHELNSSLTWARHLAQLIDDMDVVS